jgi:hypothetical protein
MEQKQSVLSSSSIRVSRYHVKLDELNDTLIDDETVTTRRAGGVGLSGRGRAEQQYYLDTPLMLKAPGGRWSNKSQCCCSVCM